MDNTQRYLKEKKLLPEVSFVPIKIFK